MLLLNIKYRSNVRIWSTKNVPNECRRRSISLWAAVSVAARRCACSTSGLSVKSKTSAKLIFQKSHFYIGQRTKERATTSNYIWLNYIIHVNIFRCFTNVLMAKMNLKGNKDKFAFCSSKFIKVLKGNYIIFPYHKNLSQLPK